MVVGLIVTAYRLLSCRRPCFLRCLTPHVVVFPFLCGSTLSRCPGYATRPYPLYTTLVKLAEVLMAVNVSVIMTPEEDSFDLLPKVDLA
jgi:hypothetical protein